MICDLSLHLGLAAVQVIFRLGYVQLVSGELHSVLLPFPSLMLLSTSCYSLSVVVGTTRRNQRVAGIRVHHERSL